jgi:5-bromo-4-chloroindolyl phosphate hydrolysis protein
MVSENMHTTRPELQLVNPSSTIQRPFDLYSKGLWFFRKIGENFELTDKFPRISDPRTVSY